LKILHVIQSLDATRGGPVSVLRGLACAQALSGHCVAVYATRNHTETRNDDGLPKASGVTISCFPVSFRPMLFSRALYWRLRTEVGDFDIVHIHGIYRFLAT